MGKNKSKDRDAKKAGRFAKKRESGIPELADYYVSYGGDRSVAGYTKVVENIANYFRIELSKDIFYLVYDGIKPEWKEIKTPGKNAARGVKLHYASLC